MNHTVGFEYSSESGRHYPSRPICGKVLLLTLFGLLVFSSCKKSTKGDASEDAMGKEYRGPAVVKAGVDTPSIDEPPSDTQTMVEVEAERFLDGLRNGKRLGQFFVEKWTLVFHSDNRCDGSTDGRIDDLKSGLIDTVIRLEVKNDGEGWECDKREPRVFEMDFNLKEQVSGWDRFEIRGSHNRDDSVLYVVGAGESDYLKLHYDDKGLIRELEYRSEDPG